LNHSLTFIPEVYHGIVEMKHLSEEEWEAISEELPSKEEPLLQKFIHGRKDLIAEEKKQRSGK
jgi:hypothetical protein